MRRLLLSAFLLLLLVPGLVLARGPSVGELAPGLLGQDPDGKPVTLDAWRGKLVVVSFWTSRCGYCLVELPTLENLQKAVGSEHLQVVVVNVNDSSKDWTTMLKQMRGYSLAQARDPAGAVASAWGVQMFPNLWLVGPDGRLQKHFEGYLEEDLPGILEQIQRAELAAFPRVPAPAPEATPATPAR
ncbi:TlpA family protein disulfide reductase [Xenophilus sp.]|uniref:TlpA family protein disulfide reductase n=1 Tax=Xenophilus sp. TaxID=1873499 RepID=UPI0037DD3F1E